MSKDKLFQRALENKCPICDKPLDGETEIVDYQDGKLEVHKKHIKYRR